MYSHSEQKLNDKRKGIKFKEGDVIQFEYIEKNLKIANESTTIELQVEGRQNGKNYYPCVYFEHVGDRVAIV